MKKEANKVKQTCTCTCTCSMCSGLTSFYHTCTCTCTLTSFYRTCTCTYMYDNVISFIYSPSCMTSQYIHVYMYTCILCSLTLSPSLVNQPIFSEKLSSFHVRMHNLKSNWLIYETTTKAEFIYMYCTCTTIYTVPHFQAGKFSRIFKFQNFWKPIFTDAVNVTPDRLLVIY